MTNVAHVKFALGALVYQLRQSDGAIMWPAVRKIAPPEVLPLIERAVAGDMVAWRDLMLWGERGGAALQ